METKGIDLTKCNNLRAKVRAMTFDRKEEFSEVGRIILEEAEGVQLLTDDGGYVDLFFNGEIDKDVLEIEIIPRDPETYRDWQVGDMIYREDPTACIGMVIFRSGDFVAVELNGSCRCYTCAELFDEGYRLELTDIEMQIIEEKKVVEDIPKPHEFRKGEPVLVRSDYAGQWLLAAIVDIDAYHQLGEYGVTDGQKTFRSRYCLPYNERTMHLLGTTVDYKEERK